MSCFSNSKYFDWSSHCAMFFSQNIHLCGTLSEIQSSYSCFWEMLIWLSHKTVPITSVQKRITALVVTQYKRFWFSCFRFNNSPSASHHANCRFFQVWINSILGTRFPLQHHLSAVQNITSISSHNSNMQKVACFNSMNNWLTTWKSQPSFNWDFTTRAFF